MPRWIGHSKSLLDFRKRFRLNADPTEILTGVLPTAVVDRSWPWDVTDVWGASGQGTAVGANEYPAVELVAQRRRLRVYRVTAWVARPTHHLMRGLRYHLFTPVQTYDPTQLNPSIWFPWLQCGYQPQQAAYLADAFLFGGAQTALQVVTVNGVNFTTYGVRAMTGGSITVGNQYVKDTEHILWDAQDPPLFVQPFTSMCVQSLVQGAGDTLRASFFFSEEEHNP